MASCTQTRAAPLAAWPWISLIVVWFVWGSTYLGIRVAVQSIPPLLMAGSRYVIAGAVLALGLWLAQRNRLAPIRLSDFKSVLVSAVLLLLIGNGALSYAEVRMQSGTASLIVASVPIWMLVIDALFARKVRPLAMLGLAVGAIGMVVLVGAPSGGVPLVSALAVLGGSVSWALGSVLARRHDSTRLHALFPALEMIAGGVLLCIAGAATGEISALHVDRVSPASAAGFAWLVVMGAIVGYTAYGYAVRTLPTTIVSTYAYVNPIVAVVLGALLLGEPLTANVLVGGAAIIAAVVVILLANRETERC